MRLVGILVVSLVFGTVLLGRAAYADERHFAYSYETDTLPEGDWEFEQWVTHENGKRGGDYAAWNLRTELEYGISSALQSSLYLNLESVRSEGVFDEEDSSETKFKGISSEWVYQLVSPIKHDVGLALYAEYSTDGIDHELENKILLSSEIEDWAFALNAIYEIESEKEAGEREKEATLEFTAGAMRRIGDGWSLGVEARQKSAYPGGYDLSEQEFQSWSVGPTVHYANQKYWVSLSVLPQVWGNGEGSRGGRQLVHEEAMEVRFLIGVAL